MWSVRPRALRPGPIFIAIVLAKGRAVPPALCLVGIRSVGRATAMRGDAVAGVLRAAFVALTRAPLMMTALIVTGLTMSALMRAMACGRSFGRTVFGITTAGTAAIFPRKGNPDQLFDVAEISQLVTIRDQ